MNTVRAKEAVLGVREDVHVEDLQAARGQRVLRRDNDLVCEREEDKVQKVREEDLENEPVPEERVRGRCGNRRSTPFSG